MSLLRFFHGCPQMGEVSVFVGGDAMSVPIARGLAYGESTPHIFMHGGHTTIRVEEEGKVRVQNHVIIPENQSFTLMILCRGGVMELVAITEAAPELEEGSSGVRIASFAQGEELLEFWRWFGNEEEQLFSQITEGDVSEYAQIEPGMHRLEIRKEGGTLSILPEHRAVEGRMYTVFIIGRTHPDEEEFPVAIRVLEDMKTTIATE